MQIPFNTTISFITHNLHMYCGVGLWPDSEFESVHCHKL